MEIPGSFSDYLSLMLGKPRINNLKTSLRFPCLGLNPIIDSINPPMYSNIFTSKAAWLTEAMFHVKPFLDQETKVYSTGLGHMTKMAAMSIY